MPRSSKRRSSLPQVFILCPQSKILCPSHLFFWGSFTYINALLIFRTLDLYASPAFTLYKEMRQKQIALFQSNKIKTQKFNGLCTKIHLPIRKVLQKFFIKNNCFLICLPRKRLNRSKVLRFYKNFHPLSPCNFFQTSVPLPFFFI